MKVSGWFIDGFGHFHKEEVEDLPPGLIVVHGPNESGKTTLMDFISGMLFGFPGRDDKRRHEPVKGGTLGGRLVVADRDGTLLTIERGAARTSLRITDADGPRDPGALADLLGHANPDLFENVFAVDLDALQGLKALDQESVRDRIFSAGVVGAGQSAERALAVIGERRDALWRPKARGDAYVLRALNAEFQEATDQLREARQMLADTPAERERLAGLQGASMPCEPRPTPPSSASSSSRPSPTSGRAGPMPAKPASCWPTPAPTCRPSWAKGSSRASTTPSGPWVGPRHRSLTPTRKLTPPRPPPPRWWSTARSWPTTTPSAGWPSSAAASSPGAPVWSSCRATRPTTRTN